jgi:hypothetical protein
LPFKCNLQRYTTERLEEERSRIRDEVALCKLESSLTRSLKPPGDPTLQTMK